MGNCVFDSDNPDRSRQRLSALAGRCPHVCQFNPPPPFTFTAFAVFAARCIKLKCPKELDDVLELIVFPDSSVKEAIRIQWEVGYKEHAPMFFHMDDETTPAGRQSLSDNGLHFLWALPPESGNSTPVPFSRRVRVIRQPWSGGGPEPLSIRLKMAGWDSGDRYLQIAPAPSGGQNQVTLPLPPTANLIQDLREIRLREYQVVGDYCRFNAATKKKLQGLVDQIREDFRRGNLRRANYLIWGQSGTGKTALVKAIAEECGVRYVEANLAKLEQDAFLAQINATRKCPDPVLCLVDEIGMKEKERWPYECFFSELDANVNKSRNQPIVWVMAGSTGACLEELVNQIKSRWNGPDLLSRIPEQGGRHSVDGMVPGDTIVISSSMILSKARKLRRRMDQIEKTALYYILNKFEAAPPRQLESLFELAFMNMGPDDHVLKLRHLFPKTTNDDFKFWTKHQGAMEILDATNLSLSRV